METELTLPQEWTGKNIADMLRSSDGQIHFLLSEENGDTVSLEEWTLGENDSLENITPQWLQAIALPARENIQLQLLEPGKDNCYLYASFYEEATDTYSTKLWKENHGEALEITPENGANPRNCMATLIMTTHPGWLHGTKGWLACLICLWIFIRA